MTELARLKHSRDRMESLLRKSKKGMDSKELAKRLDINERTVQRYLKEFVSEGNLNIEKNSSPPRYFWGYEDVVEPKRELKLMIKAIIMTTKRNLAQVMGFKNTSVIDRKYANLYSSGVREKAEAYAITDECKKLVAGFLSRDWNSREFNEDYKKALDIMKKGVKSEWFKRL